MFDILNISGDDIICSHKVKDYILNDNSVAIDLFNISQVGGSSCRMFPGVVISICVYVVMADKL